MKGRDKMKGNKLKLITIILAIVLVSLVSFLGVYTQVQNRMENQLKPFEYSLDVNGERQVGFIPSTETKTVVRDSSGKEVEDGSNLTDDEIQEKGYTKEEVYVNNTDNLTAENYKLSKKIIEDKLERIGADEYRIRLDENTGNIFVELPEDELTDRVITDLLSVNKFQVVDEQTGEELMNNDDIESVRISYGSTSQEATAGTGVYMSIQFDKEGTKKFEDITKTYREGAEESSSDENGSSEETSNEESSEDSSSTEKTVALKIDDEKIMSTSFDQDISTGLLQLSLGQETTDQEALQENIQKGQEMALKLESKAMPVTYTVSENKYILSNISRECINYFKIAVTILAAVALIVLIIKFKSNGALASVAFVGFAAVLLLVLRYTNAIISLEGIFAIVLVLILNYILTHKVLKAIKESKDANKEIVTIFKDFFIKLIPVIIMGLVFNFVRWITFVSFGNVIFWGTVLIVIYNWLVTGTLLKLEVGGANNEK